MFLHHILLSRKSSSLNLAHFMGWMLFEIWWNVGFLRGWLVFRSFRRLDSKLPFRAHGLLCAWFFRLGFASEFRPDLWQQWSFEKRTKLNFWNVGFWRSLTLQFSCRKVKTYSICKGIRWPDLCIESFGASSWRVLIVSFCSAPCHQSIQSFRSSVEWMTSNFIHWTFIWSWKNLIKWQRAQYKPEQRTVMLRNNNFSIKSTCTLTLGCLSLQIVRKPWGTCKWSNSK